MRFTKSVAICYMCRGEEKKIKNRLQGADFLAEDEVLGATGQQKSRGWESNPQPTVYKTVALPVELPRRNSFYIIAFFHFSSNYYATMNYNYGGLYEANNRIFTMYDGYHFRFICGGELPGARRKTAATYVG